MLNGKGYFINSSVNSVSFLLNQGIFNTLSSIATTTRSSEDPNASSFRTTVESSTWVVPYENVGTASGVLGAKNTIQLIGSQYTASGSPIFSLEIDQSIITPQNSCVLVYLFFNSIVCTDSVGRTVGFEIKAVNTSASQLVRSASRILTRVTPRAERMTVQRPQDAIKVPTKR